MVVLPPSAAAPFRRLMGALRQAHERLGGLVGGLLPKGLYARALLIIIAPMVLLQSVLVFLFIDRHWESVTRRLSLATTQNIAMLVDVYESYPHRDNYEKLTDMAREQLRLVVEILPGDELPAARPKPFFDFLDRTLSKQIRRHVGRPFWIDTVGSSRYVEIRIKLDDAVMKILARRSQTYASNSHIFLVWMVVTSLVLLAVAILFLRNQIKPILTLALAAENFGRGRSAPRGFRVRGAREVRKAALAFMEMRDRIERHVEQRTTMLAGVSHDLRTVLTRFRLQLAMLDDGPEAQALGSDVDEMQQMLEDYLAFAKGDSGERARRVNVARMLNEIRRDAAVAGKTVTLDLDRETMVVPLRRNAFKRALVNLVGNAARFANTIAIRAANGERTLTITVEDDGPGIPESKREEVFRPFHSLDDARNQNVKSTGLGLAIARDIVRGHGGEISLGESAMGGLKATVRIPL